MSKKLLLEQFNKCYDEDGWFVALRNTLDGLTAEQAAWKPNGTENSIWQILKHLTFYNFAYTERFKGIDYKYPTDNNDETFVSGSTEEDWRAAVKRLDEVMTEWRELISSAAEEKFETPVSESNQASWTTLISNVNAHNAYHAGQILLIRKLQGSWDPAKGVS